MRPFVASSFAAFIVGLFSGVSFAQTRGDVCGVSLTSNGHLLAAGCNYLVMEVEEADDGSKYLVEGSDRSSTVEYNLVPSRQSIESTDLSEILRLAHLACERGDCKGLPSRMEMFLTGTLICSSSPEVFEVVPQGLSLLHVKERRLALYRCPDVTVAIVGVDLIWTKSAYPGSVSFIYSES